MGAANSDATVYSQGGLFQGKTTDGIIIPRCFTMWMAGGGAKAGIVHGENGPISATNVVKRPGARGETSMLTVLRLLGIDHQKAHLQVSGSGTKIDRELCRQKIVPELMS